MPVPVTKSLLGAAKGAARHLAWYLGYRTGATGPREL